MQGASYLLTIMIETIETRQDWRLESFSLLLCRGCRGPSPPWSHKVFAIVPGGLLLCSMPGFGCSNQLDAQAMLQPPGPGCSGSACKKVPKNLMVYRQVPIIFLFFTLSLSLSLPLSPQRILVPAWVRWMLAPPGRSPRTSKMMGKPSWKWSGLQGFSLDIWSKDTQIDWHEVLALVY